MADHREISVAEFFEKNRHLLGFNNPQKAIITCVKEAVDNSLDACEEEKILPEIHVNVEETGDERLRLQVKDNAVGIDRSKIPKIFGKLLYGSKFHKLQQTRGQQGIGISASGLYAQLTTGKPVKIYSKKKGNEDTHMFKVHIDTQENEPEIVEDRIVDDYDFDHGTSIDMEIEGKYTHGHHSVPTYLKHTAIMNPYAKLVLNEPDGNKIEYPRVSKDLPPRPKEIKPHPHGVELGILMRMVENTNARTVSSFLKSEFTRVGRTSAENILEKAGINKKKRPPTLEKADMEDLLDAMQNVNLQNPPTNCLSPIGERLIDEGLEKELNPEFVASVTRSPSVYRGNPYQIEAAIAFGGDIKSKGTYKMLRYANKVPLLYKKSSCATTKAVRETDWSRYGLKQKGERPKGPVYILVHMASVWVPFTSEGKEAVANYPEIVKEMKLALQEVGRKTKTYLSKKRKAKARKKKKKQLTAYGKVVSPSIADLAGAEDERVKEQLMEILNDRYGETSQEKVESQVIKNDRT
ncbi:MAG: DNA topoisomerase VI subunit B [Candidatus Nanohaloarchaeota archaeon QJJ-9]|nr:DNA topoisomerase VI subunit B [Candidatus Nanohaloarchaeota archaeon QJJ-9]